MLMDAVVRPVVEDPLELAKPSANFENTPERRRVQKHAAVLVDLLRLQAERFVQRHSSEPLLEQFCSDGTEVVDDGDDRVAVGQVQGAVANLFA